MPKVLNPKKIVQSTKQSLILIITSLILSGCQIGYIVSSGYNQLGLLSGRVPIKKALDNHTISEKVKAKLRLAQKTKTFAEKHLGLTPTDNYDTYVKLDRDYVTYAVSAAPQFELKHHLWSFPFIGKVPYKGYFDKNDALEEEKKLKKEKLDTYVRGVSAYSTLGWFDDPILSSMTTYKDYDLVNLIIHETVHATIYIPDNADFNERLATFLGNKGTEIFYLSTEGKNSPTLEKIKLENQDEKLFSEFITHELNSLEKWYVDNKGSISEENKKARLDELKESFRKKVLPKIQTLSYKGFTKAPLNNAYLLAYKTYVSDLSDFELLYESMGKDFFKFIQFCKGLEKEKDPSAILKKRVATKI